LTPDHLKEVVKAIPGDPGVYKYFNKTGDIIYIGKAKNLKKRVSSYFTKQKHESGKTSRLVRQIQSIEYIVVSSEIDALLLENSLIKEYQPKYNVMLKDDRSYPFIRITNERFPKVYSMRNIEKDGSEYYGPYTSVRMMNVLLDLIRKLHPTRNCNLNLSEENILANKFKICLEYQIGNCKGPCEDRQSEEDYMIEIGHIREILKGNLSVVKQFYKSQMAEAAEGLEFEVAQDYKEKLLKLESYQSKSTIVNPKLNNIDVFSIVSDGDFAFINYLKLFNGIITQTLNLEYKKKLDESDEDILSLAIAEIRTEYQSKSEEVIVPFDFTESYENIKFTVPKVGDKKKLLELSMKNALYFKREKLNQYEKLNPELRVDRLMAAMKKDLKLTEEPRHIECFDNSNFQGTNPVSACVVFRNGKPHKSDYRHFNIKTVEGPDDFASMAEAVTRRYARMLKEEQPLPQLLVVDGGKGQLSATVNALKDMQLYGKIAVIGIAKRLEEIYYPDDPLPLYIDKKSETLKVIQRMRDEAHRFGITHHRLRRRKGTLKSELTEIEGIGPKVTELLLKKYKSVKKVSSTTEAELSALIGPVKARKIYSHFNEK
jgi:excinuclease ABC subunit C